MYKKIHLVIKIKFECRGQKWPCRIKCTLQCQKYLLSPWNETMIKYFSFAHCEDGKGTPIYITFEEFAG